MEPPAHRRHSRFPRSTHFSRQSFDTRSLDDHWEDRSSRPKSMSDFQSLLDASASVNGNGHPRKKSSISLAQGLMMTTESPRSYSLPDESSVANPAPQDGPWSQNLFYAYAQKSDFAQSAPYILTFASARTADEWWSLVQREYPESTRPGPQLFILKGDDMQEQIQDNPKFYDLRNSWFYTPSESSTAPIPLQDYHGHPVTAPPPPKPEPETPAPDSKTPFDFHALETTLSQMTALITQNTESIHALSVAQSTGLQTMQDINESTSTQIKALADNQASLQSLVSQNATQHLALSNHSFSAQSSISDILSSNAAHIAALAEGQSRLVETCADLMRGVERIGNGLEKVGERVERVGEKVEGREKGLWEEKSMACEMRETLRETERGVGMIVNRIQPPPRKLNRRVKGVWYEYDDEPEKEKVGGVGGVGGKENKVMKMGGLEKQGKVGVGAVR